MKRSLLAALVLGAALLVPVLAASAAPPTKDVVCPQDTNFFSGTARDLIVPEGGYCAVTGANIERNLIVQDFAGADILQTSVGHDVSFEDFAGAFIFQTTIGHDLVAGEESGFDIADVTVGHDVALVGPGGGMHAERLTIGRDFFASKPQTVQTGRVGEDTPGGPVNVGRDFLIDGSPDFEFVFDGICDVNVERDFRITNRSVTLGFGIGNICARNSMPPNTVGRDMVITGNAALDGFFGPSSLIVGDNHVGRDLVFSNNTAVPGGHLEVSRNVVSRDATCAANSPAVTVNGPNVAGRSNTCG